MKDCQAFLLSRAGWRDEKGNTVVFSPQGLQGETVEHKIWLFLDEGLRCGGMHRPIEPKPEAVRDALLGIGKKELWQAMERDWNEEA